MQAGEAGWGLLHMRNEEREVQRDSTLGPRHTELEASTPRGMSFHSAFTLGHREHLQLFRPWPGFLPPALLWAAPGFQALLPHWAQSSLGEADMAPTSLLAPSTSAGGETKRNFLSLQSPSGHSF